MRSPPSFWNDFEKSPAALQIRRCGGGVELRLRVLPLLVCLVEEQFVLLDRPADGAAPDMILHHACAAGDAVGHRVQGGIASEIITHAVEIVGAGLHRHVQGAARAEAELGIECVLLYRHFLHGVHGRHVGTASRETQRHSVQQHVVLAASPAADVQTVRRPHIERVAMRHVPVLVDYSRIEHRQRKRIARQNRNVLEHRPLDRCGHGGAGRFERCGYFAHRNRFRHAANFQHHVHGDVAASKYAEIFLYELAETGSIHRNGVGARQNEIE